MNNPNHSTIDDYDMPPLESLDPNGVNLLLSAVLETAVRDIVGGFRVYLQMNAKMIDIPNYMNMIDRITKLLPRKGWHGGRMLQERKNQYNYWLKRIELIRTMIDSIRFLDGDWCALMIGSNDRLLALENAADQTNAWILDKAANKIPKRRYSDVITLKTRREWSASGYVVRRDEVATELPVLMVKDRDHIAINKRRYFTNYQVIEKRRTDK